MKTPKYITYTFQPETVTALDRLQAACPGTVAAHEGHKGATAAEPLLILFDSAIRYAKAYRAYFDRPMAGDYVAEPEIAGILSGARGLLNFNGGVSLERGSSRDSKDNGVLESLYWIACDIAGLDGDNL